MRRKVSVEDLQRKILIVFYPENTKNLEGIKKYFHTQYYEVVGETKFSNITTDFFEQTPDLIVCQNRYAVLSSTLGKYIYYLPEESIEQQPKEIYKDIRKTAYTNYIKKIKSLIEKEINKAEPLEKGIAHLVNLFDLKDYYLRDHAIRVMEYSIELAKKLKLKRHEITNLCYAALLHDMGKLVLPTKVLEPSSEKSKYDQLLFRYHPLIGSYLLDTPKTKEILPILKYHHERIDGRGYFKKKAEELPVSAKILALTDYFDLLTTTTYYGKRYSFEEAKKHLQINSFPQKTKRNKQMFDTKITITFVKMLNQNPTKFQDINQCLHESLFGIDVEKQKQS